MAGLSDAFKSGGGIAGIADGGVVESGFRPDVANDSGAGVDSDSDGYISFQELMRAVNEFFDGTNNLTLQDLYDLNEYFFAQ